MKARYWVFTAMVFVGLVSDRGLSQTTAQSNLPPKCTNLLQDAYANSQKFSQPADIKTAVYDAFDALRQANMGPCLQAMTKQLAALPVAAAGSPTIKSEDIAPARNNLLIAIANYSPQQQQSATTSSTSVVSPISKLTGFSSLAQEFAGVNVSSSSSSMTLSLSMQSLLEDLVHQGMWLPCSNLLVDQTHCIGRNWYGFARRFTPSITASTSSAIKGTADSTATPTPVTLSTPGSTWPSFGGFGLKGVAWYRKGAANPNTQVSDLMSSAFQAAKIQCTDYDAALDHLLDQMSDRKQAPTENDFENVFASGYQNLLVQLGACLNDPATNKQGLTNKQVFQKFVAEQVISTIADIDANTTPAIGFEYDLSTPLNQPSYSTAKGNVSWQFGKPPAKKATPSKSAKAGAASPPASNTSATGAEKQQNWVEAVYETILSSASADGSTSLAPTTKNASGASDNTPSAKTTKAAAGAQTPPLTLNLMVDGEFYNSQPSNSIPAARRLRDVQVGFEADYILRASDKYWLTKFIGDSTLSASYLYQDQTSPSIVNAPPSGISFSNLPSTATTVYTSRGPINLGQVRWGLGTGTNVSFPIAFTYSNRSQLIDHPIKGLQFGLSYNLSSLFSNNATNNAK
jgi:hypothetical protein